MHQKQYTIQLNQKCTIDLTGKHLPQLQDVPPDSILISSFLRDIFNQETICEDNESNKWWMVITDNIYTFTGNVQEEVEQFIRDYYYDKGHCFILGENETYHNIEERQYVDIPFDAASIFLSFPKKIFIQEGSDDNESLLYTLILNFLKQVNLYLSKKYSTILGENKSGYKKSSILNGLLTGLKNAKVQEDIDCELNAIEECVESEIQFFLNHVSHPIRGVVVVYVSTAYYKKIIKEGRVPISIIRQFCRVIALTISKFATIEEYIKVIDMVSSSSFSSNDDKNIYNTNNVPEGVFNMMRRDQNMEDLQVNEISRAKNSKSLDDIIASNNSQENKEIDNQRTSSK